MRLLVFAATVFAIALTVGSCDRTESTAPSRTPDPGLSAPPADGDSPPESAGDRPDGAPRDVSTVARVIERSVSGAVEPGDGYPSIGLLSADPVVSAGVLIVGGADGTLTARESAGSDPRWQTRYDAPIAALAVNPDALLVAAGSLVSRVSPASGEALWTVTSGARIATRITLSPSALYVGLANGEILSLSIEDGSTRWRRRVDSTPVDRIPVADGVAYAATSAGSLSAVSASTGELLWSRTLPGGFAAAPALAPGRICAVTVAGDVAIIGTDGSLRAEWRIAAAPILVSPIWYRDRIIIVDGEGTIGLFEQNGAEIWQVGLTSHLSGIPVRVGDTLVAGEYEGGVVGIDLRAGSEISRTSLGSGIAGEAAYYSDALYVAQRDGSVRVLGIDGEYQEVPLFSSEGSWVLPRTGVFRLEDDRVSLTMRSGRDAVFEITVSSAPAEDLVIQVVSDNGAVVATNMGKVTLSPTVRAPLEAGQSYQLQVSRPEPSGAITLSVQTTQLQ